MTERFEKEELRQDYAPTRVGPDGSYAYRKPENGEGPAIRPEAVRPEPYHAGAANGGRDGGGKSGGAPRHRSRKSGIGRGCLTAVSAVLLVCLCLGAGFLGGRLGARTQQEALQARLPEATPAVTAQPQATVSPLQQQMTQPEAALGAAEESSLSVAQVAAVAADTVVEINTQTVVSSFMQESIAEGAGSGVIVDGEEGYIITNDHVIDGATQIVVTLRSGSKYEAELVGTDALTDIAVLRIRPEEPLTAATLGDSGSLQVGEIAVAIGNPLGQLGGSVTEGIISALDREIAVEGEVMTVLQTSAAINSGNSGGGLFNGKGQLIGIVNAKSSGLGVEGLGFAIPINTAYQVAQQLVEYGHVPGRVDMGFTLVDIQDPYTARSYRVDYLGVYVGSVTRSGLSVYPGDLILAVEGESVADAQAFKAAMQPYSVGDTVTLTVYRSGRRGNVTVTLYQQE